MFADFDVNEKTRVISLLQFSQDGTKKITSYDLNTKKLIGEIGYEYLPLGPRLSPNKNQLTFFSNSSQLYLWDMKNSHVRTIFDHPFLDPGFCEWSYCGNQICFSAYSTDIKKKTPPNIYLMDMKNLKVVQLTESEGVDRFPQWSPSNQFIAFHRQDLNEPNSPKKIYIVDTKTKACTSIPHSDGTNHLIGRYCWSKDSAHILVKEDNYEGVHLKVFCAFNRVLEWTFTYPDVVGGAFLNNEHILVVCKKELLIILFPEGEIIRKIRLPNSISIQQTLRGPSISLSYIPDNIYFLNEESCLYRLNRECSLELLLQNSKDELPVFTHKEYVVKSRDGYNIPVNSYTPVNPKDMGILLIHGGPGERIDDPNNPIIIRLLKEGYEVIVPAYRGCAGYGEDHRNANIGEYGRADVWDVLATGFDWKSKADARPLTVMGYSYGGFLTFLALSYSEVPWDLGATLWGVTSIEHLGLHLPRAYPNDPLERRKAQRERSPMEQASKIRTPLLILHGGRDTTATTEEVKLIQKNIHSHGGTCKLVIYDNETHGLGKKRLEMFEQIFSFIKRF